MIQNITITYRKLLGAVVILSLFTSACADQQQQATGPRAIPVKLETIQSSTLIDSTQYVGYLESRQRVALAPRIQGQIVKIFVEEGDAVNVGQPIAELEPTREEEQVFSAAANVQNRIAAFNQAEAELRQRQAERDGAESEIARLKADVARAQSDFRSREAEVQRALGDLDLAQVNYKRADFLVNEGVQPTQDLDDNTRNLNTAKANLESTRKLRDSALASVEAAQGALQASINNLQAAEERIQAARAVVDQAKAAIEEAQGQLGAINQDLVYNTMSSPIKGVVGDFNEKKVGDFMNVGEEFTTITDNEVFLLNISIPTEFYNRLRIGLPVEILNNDGTPRIRGQVSFVAPRVRQDAQTVLTKITFRNDGSLRNNQYVRVRVIWDEKPGVLVPTAAVTKLGGQSFVFVAENAESDNGQTSLVARQTPIEVGTIQGQAYQVLDGLQPGDKIAVTRILDLQDNSPITTESLQSQTNEK